MVRVCVCARARERGREGERETNERRAGGQGLRQCLKEVGCHIQHLLQIDKVSGFGFRVSGLELRV